MTTNLQPHDVNLIELVQVLCRNATPAVLVLENGARDGEIHFREGRVAHAFCEELRGNPALRELLSWKTGALRLVAPTASSRKPAEGEASSVVGLDLQGEKGVPGLEMLAVELAS